MEIDLGIPGLTQYQEIGSGGFSVAYSAFEPSAQRTVAVKVLAVSDEAGRRRFERECRSLGQTTAHDNIVTMLRSGYTEPDGRPYLVMEYMAGGSLQDQISAEGQLAPNKARQLLLPVAAGLGYAHSLGIVHRDVKPANILISEFGSAKLSDFGVAAIRDSTSTSQVAYSIHFTSPETFQAVTTPGGETLDPRDHRSDLYSLTASYYAAVTGRPPFVTRTQAAQMKQILTDPPPPVDRDDLDAFFAVGLAKHPDGRFQTAEEFAEALGQIGDYPAPLARPAANLPTRAKAEAGIGADVQTEAATGAPTEAATEAPTEVIAEVTASGTSTTRVHPMSATGRAEQIGADYPTINPGDTAVMPSTSDSTGANGPTGERPSRERPATGGRARPSEWIIGGAVLAVLILVGALLYAATRSDGNSGDGPNDDGLADQPTSTTESTTTSETSTTIDDPIDDGSIAFQADGDFDQLSLDGRFQVRITLADGPATVAITTDHSADDLDIEAGETTLQIGVANGQADDIGLLVTMPGLTAIEVSGATRAAIDGLDADELEIRGEDQSAIRLDAAIDQLDVELNDTATLTGSGAILTLTITLDGVSTADLTGATVGVASVDLSRSSILELGPTGRVDGDLNGAANLVVPTGTEVDVDQSPGSTIEFR